MTRNSIPSQPTILLSLGATASGNSEEEEKSETPAFFFAMSFATTSKLTVFCRQYSTAALPSTERVGLGLATFRRKIGFWIGPPADSGPAGSVDSRFFELFQTSTA